MKKLNFTLSMSALLFLVVTIYFGVIQWELDPQIPIVLTVIYTSILAILRGVKWKDLEDSIIKALSTVNQAMLVLLVIGMMLGTWLHSGVVPTMIYYGAKVISPSFFLPTACLLCSVSSLATGDSWGTAGTVGIALLGIGLSFDIPAPMIAGAIVSGSYFGDKLSPMSDTTLLASAVAEVDLFDHIRYMLYTTIPALAIATIAYYFIGIPYAHNVDVAQISVMLEELKLAVNIHPVLLLAPLFVIAMIALKVEALPALMGGTLLGSAFAMIFQNATLQEVMHAMHMGVTMDTGNAMIDELVSGGGLDYVMWTISLVYCAMALGGVLEGSGALEAIVQKIMRFVKSTGALIASTVLTSVFMNFATADQYLAILFPSKMYQGAFDERGLDRRVLSRALEDGGTLTSALFPWNTCGAFLFGVLGVSPFVYAPYAILNWLSPLLSIFYGVLGFKILYAKKPASGDEKI